MNPESRAWPAPAKINLFLHVLGRRQDGYHELQTLFQLLNWGDDLYFARLADGQIRRSEANYDLPEEQDLVVQAARALKQVCDVRLGAEIRVHKRIPAGAGLGGGSSNAATTLVVLNRLWRCGLDDSDLASIGAQLGADVPVFVRGRSALAEGVGERLEAVELGKRHYLLVMPEIHIPTESIFGDPGLQRNSSALSRLDALAGRGRNDCEAVVLERIPGYRDIMEFLRPWGDPVMTGTGSAIFLRMPDESAANRAARELKSHYNVRAVSGLDVSPLHEKLQATEFD